MTSEAAADAARRRRRRQTEQESSAAAPPVATVEAKLVSAVEAKSAAQVTTVEAVVVAPVAEAALPRDMPRAKKIERKKSFDRQMKFLLKAEQQEEAPL